MDRPTFSPFWHRVRALKPKLRPHVQITRQHYRGRRWHVVHDPASNQFYRLSPIAHELVCTLDGQRSVEDAWNLSLQTHGDDAPTQPEVIELLGQMYSSNLLSLDTAPETEQLLARGRDRAARRWKSQAIGIMYFKIPLFNPDAYLSWLQPILRPLLNRVGFVLWLALAIAGLVSLVPYWSELTSGLGSAVSPGNWPWLIVAWIVLKIVHETGHGVLCKHFGGQVPEFGVMLLVLLPSPYVDASATWAFANKWRRMAVGAGGMIFEIAVAAVSAFVWIATRGTGTESGQLVHQLAYNTMLTSGISTVLFNANPLMRFDGYYILSDLLEVPNLMQRSQKHLQYVFQKYVYRLDHTRPVTSVPAERSILTIYGVLALIYRFVIFFGITVYLIGQFFALGVILAMWSMVAWIVLPVGKFVHWLASSPQLMDKRGRTIAISAGLAAAVLLLTGILPMPDHRRAWGVVESTQRTGVYFGTDGFIEVVHKRAGDAVVKGEPIVTLTSKDLEVTLAGAKAGLDEALAQERSYLAQGIPAAAQIGQKQVQLMNDYIAELERRMEALIVRAPHDGVVVGQDPIRLGGRYARRGQMLCEVADQANLRVSANLTQAEASWLYELRREDYQVQMRRLGRPDEVSIGGEVVIPKTGQRELAHSSLGAAGGGSVELDAGDETGLLAKSPQFEVRISPAEGLRLAGLPGERVGVRFTLPSKPLLTQWIDRFRKIVQGRVQI